MSIKILKMMNLLYLEDDLKVAKNMQESLEVFFKKVLFSESVKKGYELFESEKIDVIIVDIELKDGSGLEFIRKIRVKSEKIPIMVISSHSNVEYLLEAIPLNLIKYLIKPVTYEKLMDVLKELVGFLERRNSLVVSLSNGVSLNLDTKMIWGLDENLHFTSHELELLALLVENANEYVSYRLIEKQLYDGESCNKGTIRNHINKFRTVFGKGFIESSSGLGYKAILL